MEMAPYLWLGFGVAGLLHVFWPVETIVRHLGGNSKKAVFKASVLGIPLPLCSCGVLPVATQLRKSGAGAAPTLSFLITTPVTGVDSLLATWAILGWMFTLVRLVASFVLGLATGLLAALFLPETSAVLPEDTAGDGCESGSCAVPAPHGAPLAERLADAFHYGFWELPTSMASSVLLGLFLGGIITALVPASVVADTVGTGPVGVTLAVAVAIPLYVCATGSIPIAASLMLKGFSPGAALAFLMAGPASNAVAITTVRKLLGNRHALLYLAVIFAGSLGFGMLFDLGLLAADVSFSLSAAERHAAHAGSSWVAILSGIALFGVMAAGLVVPLLPRLRRFLRRKPAKEDASMTKNHVLRLSVPDMNCAHCKATVSKLLSSQPGVSDVEVNLADRIVEIHHAEDLAQDAVLEKMADAGYPCRIL